MTKEERMALIQEAKESGCSSITIEGVVYTLASVQFDEVIRREPMSEEEIQNAVKKMSVLDEYSEEEILYYSTPYFEQLQAQKELRAKQLKEEATNG